MTWLLIYLFVMIESIGGIFTSFWVIFPAVVGGIVLLVITANAAMEGVDHGSYGWEKTWHNEHIKSVRKWCVGFLIFAAISTTIGKFIPTQKDLAIIVAATATYQIVTSETGERIGGKALQLLEKKIEGALAEGVAEIEQGISEKLENNSKILIDEGTNQK